MMNTEEKMSSSLRWYNRRHDEYNAQRREKYAADKKLRMKAKKQARRYRARLRAGYKPDPAVKYREVNGKVQEVFSTGGVARDLGVSSTTLRKWETYSKIPDAFRIGERRYFTDHQRSLLRVFVKVSCRGKKSKILASDFLFEHWHDE